MLLILRGILATAKREAASYVRRLVFSPARCAGKLPLVLRDDRPRLGLRVPFCDLGSVRCRPPRGRSLNARGAPFSRS
jgi:hypothetical protein